MRDRFTLLGIAALVVALLATAWQLNTRAPQTTNAGAVTVASAAPTAVAQPSATLPPLKIDTEVLVVHLDGLPGASAYAEPGDDVALYAFFPAELNAGRAETRVVLRDAAVVSAGPSAPATRP